jgi:hypothetical protein
VRLDVVKRKAQRPMACLSSAVVRLSLLGLGVPARSRTLALPFQEVKELLKVLFGHVFEVAQECGGYPLAAGGTDRRCRHSLLFVQEIAGLESQGTGELGQFIRLDLNTAGQAVVDPVRLFSHALCENGLIYASLVDDSTDPLSN